MQRQIAIAYGLLIGLLAVIGIFSGGHLFGFINTDPALSIARLVLAVMLLAAGFKSDETIIRGVLVFVGVLFIGVGVLGLLSASVWGILPAKLTGFDILLHLLSGVAALLAGFKSESIPSDDA